MEAEATAAEAGAEVKGQGSGVRGKGGLPTATQQNERREGPCKQEGKGGEKVRHTSGDKLKFQTHTHTHTHRERQV